MLNADQTAALRDLATKWENSRHLSPEPEYSMGYDAGQQSAAWALEEVLDSALFKAPAEVFVVTVIDDGDTSMVGVRLSLDEAKTLAEQNADPYFGGPLPAWSDAQTSGFGKVFYTLTVQTGPNDHTRCEVTVEPVTG